MRVFDPALERQRELEQDAACDNHQRRLNLSNYDNRATPERSPRQQPDPGARPSAQFTELQVQAADVATSGIPASNDIAGTRHADFAWNPSPQFPFHTPPNGLVGQQRRLFDPERQSFGFAEIAFDPSGTRTDRFYNDDELKEASDRTKELPTKPNDSRRRRRDLGEPWIRAVLDCLNRFNPKNAKSNAFLVRQGTAMGDPTQSRSGTDMWLPHKDLDSEYMRMYHPFTTDHYAYAATEFPTGGNEVQASPANTDSNDPPAVALLINCSKVDPTSDAEVTRKMSIAMSEMNYFQQAAYVNAKDKNGIAALHLAVAFGFLATCSLLIEHEANHKLTTNENARPHCFALAAERLAGRERKWGLYMRIMLCREHVRYGKRPPVPRLDPKNPDDKRRDRGFRRKPCFRSRAAPRATHSPNRTAARKETHANKLSAVNVDSPQQDEVFEKISGIDGWPGGLDPAWGSPSTPEISMPQHSQYISPISLFPPSGSRPPSSRHTETRPAENSARSSFAMDEAATNTVVVQPLTPGSMVGASGSADLIGTESIMQNISSNPFPHLPLYEDLYPGSLPFQHANQNAQGWPDATVDWSVPQDDQSLGFDYSQGHQGLDQSWNDQYGSYSEQGAQSGGLQGFAPPTLQQPEPAPPPDHNTSAPPALPQMGYIQPTNNYVNQFLPLNPQLGSIHVPPSFQMPNPQSNVTNSQPPMYEPDAGFWAEAPARPQHNYHYL